MINGVTHGLPLTDGQFLLFFFFKPGFEKQPLEFPLASQIFLKTHIYAGYSFDSGFNQFESWVLTSNCVCSVTSNPPGSSVHGIFQTRLMEWSSISDAKGSSWPRDRTHVFCASCVGRQILYCLSHEGSPLISPLSNLFTRGSSQPRDWTQVSHVAGRFFNIWATREAL